MVAVVWCSLQGLQLPERSLALRENTDKVLENQKIKGNYGSFTTETKGLIHSNTAAEKLRANKY